MSEPPLAEDAQSSHDHLVGLGELGSVANSNHT